MKRRLDKSVVRGHAACCELLCQKSDFLHSSLGSNFRDFLVYFSPYDIKESIRKKDAGRSAFRGT